MRAGEFEAEIELDPGSRKIRTMLVGAREKEPPAGVRAAAEAALGLARAWDRGRFEQVFDGSFTPEEVERSLAEVRAAWGDCRIAGVDLASPTGALFKLGCERGERLMIVDVDEEGLIRRFAIQAPRERANSRTGSRG